MKTSIYKFLPTKKSTSRLEEKKQVNIPWNSKLFFQIGLVISILLAYLAIESTSQVSLAYTPSSLNNYLDENPMVNYVLEEPKIIPKKEQVKKERPKPKKQLVAPVLKLIDNTSANKTEKTLPTHRGILNTLNKNIKKPVTTAKNTSPKNVRAVEVAPVFPGCEDVATNAARIQCFSDKIKRFVEQKFNAERNAGNLSGKQRIPIAFTIDEQGNVTQINVYTKDKLLKKEAIRVLSKLPKMTPAKQGNIPVKVNYILPLQVLIETY
jgi:protein TonB